MGGGEENRAVVSEPPIHPSSLLKLPRLYCIIDRGCFSAADPLNEILAFARELLAGGAALIQYRNKIGTAREILSHARELRRVVCAGRWPMANGTGQRPTTNGQRPLLVMNDRPDLALAAAFDGVHIGQHDLSPAAARRAIKDGIIGVSTHNLEQLRTADSTDCDYIAIGPVFETSSKRNPDPVIGLDGVRAARAATPKPLVAIGGITRANCRDVIAAGADSVAIISDLLHEPRIAVTEFLSLLS
jgi:thiamine-phosphate pyrophosphorylase